jgi:hypothetical protein
MPGDERISGAGRKARFEQWEKYGADRLKSDLEADPYRRVGSKAVQDLAWEFVRMKQAEKSSDAQEILGALGLHPQTPLSDLAAGPRPLSELVSGQGPELDHLVSTLPVALAPSATPAPPPAHEEKPVELLTLKPGI